MTVRSVLLDLTLSAYFMSDGSGSHCRMTFEKSKEIQHFHCPQCCTTMDMPYPNVLTHMLSTFSPPVPGNIFQHEIVTLYHWEFAVFNDALCSHMWFRLCCAFDA